MNNSANGKSIYGKSSFGLAMTAVFTIIFALLNLAVFRSEAVHIFLIFAIPALAAAGLITGIIALLREKAIAGFIFSLILMMLIFPGYLVFFTYIFAYI